MVFDVFAEPPSSLVGKNALASPSVLGEIAVDFEFDAVDSFDDYDFEAEAEDELSEQSDISLETLLTDLKQQDYHRAVSLLADQLGSQYVRTGKLSYKDLIQAIRALEYKREALKDLCSRLVELGVRVGRSTSLYLRASIPEEEWRIVEGIFAPLLDHNMDSAQALHKLGYDAIPLQKSERDLLIDALERHTLSRADERHLFEDIEQAGGPQSGDALPMVRAIIEDNLWQVGRAARIYLGRGLPLHDLFQEGVLGLFRAVARFDTKAGNRFMNYSGNWIHQAMRRAVQEKTRLIRLPVHVSERIAIVERAEDELWQELEREPTMEEIAQRIGAKIDVVHQAFQARQDACSLEYLLEEQARFSSDGSEGDGSESDDHVLGDLYNIIDGSQEDELYQQSLVEDVGQLLLLLGGRAQAIIELRYGFDGGGPRTLEEVAKHRGLTRERIRQLETNALKTLRYSKLPVGVLRAYISEVPSEQEDATDKANFGDLLLRDQRRKAVRKTLVTALTSMGYSSSLAEIEAPSFLKRMREYKEPGNVEGRVMGVHGEVDQLISRIQARLREEKKSIGIHGAYHLRSALHSLEDKLAVELNVTQSGAGLFALRDRLRNLEAAQIALDLKIILENNNLGNDTSTGTELDRKSGHDDEINYFDAVEVDLHQSLGSITNTKYATPLLQQRGTAADQDIAATGQAPGDSPQETDNDESLEGTQEKSNLSNPDKLSILEGISVDLFAGGYDLMQAGVELKDMSFAYEKSHGQSKAAEISIFADMLFIASEEIKRLRNRVDRFRTLQEEVLEVSQADRIASGNHLSEMSLERDQLGRAISDVYNDPMKSDKEKAIFKVR